MHPPGQGAAAVRRRLQAPTWVRTACWEVRRAPEGDKNGRPRRKSGTFEGQVRGCEGTSQGRRRRVAAAGAAGAGRPLGPGAARAARAQAAQRRSAGSREGARGRARARAASRGPRGPRGPPRRRRGDPADRRRSGGGRGALGRRVHPPGRGAAAVRPGCRHSRGFGRRAASSTGTRGGKNSRPCRKSGTPEGQVRGCEGASQRRRRRVAAAGAAGSAGAGRPLGPGAARGAARHGRPLLKN